LPDVRKEAERGGEGKGERAVPWGSGITLPGMPSVTYFLQLGSTSQSF
jgi:hypothetical protein